MPSFLDFVFPKKCVGCGRWGEYICPRCRKTVEFAVPVCPICQRPAVGGRTHPGCSKKFGLDGMVCGSRYKVVVRKAISQVKYRWTFDVAKVLVDLLVENIWRFNLPKNYVLVPIPLHRKRENWRGFNQAEKFCDIICKRFGVRVGKVLVKVIETKPQVGLSREERKKNIKGAFRLSQKEKVEGRNFILVDDVYTTGSTMNEACRVLKEAGAGEVWAMTVALG